MVKIHYESKLAKAILWGGYSTITLFGMVFTKRKESQMSDDDKRHETLHAIQQRDCLWLGLIVSVVLFGTLMLCGIQSWWFILYAALLTLLWYYVMYVTEWIFGLIWNLFHGWGDKTQKRSYYTISFEQESYEMEDNPSYLENRKFCAWFKYYFSTKIYKRKL